jgi:hypothetical protein
MSSGAGCRRMSPRIHTLTFRRRGAVTVRTLARAGAATLVLIVPRSGGFTVTRRSRLEPFLRSLKMHPNRRLDEWRH